MFKYPDATFYIQQKDRPRLFLSDLYDKIY